MPRSHGPGLRDQGASPAVASRGDGTIAFGRYRLIERLGQGGMADVYRARLDGIAAFSRELAIKRIRASFVHERKFLDMLATEARVTALLHHPSIVQVYELGAIGDELYLAMELADGPDMTQVLAVLRRHGLTMPPGLACWVIGQVASALSYAHSLTDGNGRPLGIIHRDISPSNIMLGLVGGVKLLDFGIAKAAAHLRDERTRTGFMKGKTGFLAPESINGTAIDHRVDQYALGIVFYECLTGKRPFSGWMRDADVVPPSRLVPTVPPEADALVMRMLQSSRDERFPDCGALAEVLTPLARTLQGDSFALSSWLKALGPFASRADVLDDEARARTPSPGFRDSQPRREISATQLAQPRRHAPTFRRELMLPLACALGGLAILALLLFAGGGRARVEYLATTPAVRAAAPPAEATPPRPVAASQTRLVIVGTAGAEVLIDGGLIGHVPIDVRVPRSTEAHDLVVRRDGYYSSVHSLVLDRDLELTATLEPLPKARPVRNPVFLVRDPFAR